jgi:hypothetical protein
MEIPARIHVNEEDLLEHYNNLEGEELEEVEDYIGEDSPFKKIHVAQLVSYHLLGECEFVYVEID